MSKHLINGNASSGLVSLKRWTSWAALASGIAFLALSVTFPLLLHDIAKMENRLINEREIFHKLSNSMWDELMAQDRAVRRTRADPSDPSSYSPGYFLLLLII